MPRLACWSCGRQIYTVSPIESLFAEERRCPRCGKGLNNERRNADRREVIRRQSSADAPAPSGTEQRVTEDRRKERRRRNSSDGSNRTGGWTAR